MSKRNEKTNLRPCRYCGSLKLLVVGDHEMGSLHYVTCLRCRTDGPVSEQYADLGRSQAVERWNHGLQYESSGVVVDSGVWSD